ncbi:MAG: class I SAM-dependent methyltransferase [Candidatus Shapirobacteria bacterium]
MIITWWLALFIIGLIFLPLTVKIFPRFFDQGYLFSKIIGLVVLTFTLWFLSVLKNIVGRRLLEIGSGTGTIIEALPSFDQVVGNDISHQAILFLKKKFRKNPKISFIEGDFLKIDPGKNFDTLVCLHVLEHIADLPKMVAKMTQIAQKIIIIVPNEEKRPYMPSYHLHFFNSRNPVTHYFPHRHNQLTLIDGDYFLISDPKPHAH